MVDEVDQHREVDQHERLGDGDREMRDERAVGFVRDRDERQDRIDERGDEDPERDLVADVTDEVPHHARPELLRREREGHDRDREHDADDGDDGRSDPDEHLATRVRTACRDPERQGQVPVVDGPVDLERGEEQETGDEHEDGRHEPEGGAECLPAPARQPALPAARPHLAGRRGGALGPGHRNGCEEA